MRNLTEEEYRALDARRSVFDSFRTERMPVLTDFFERLEIPNAHEVLLDANKFLPALDEFMRDLEITPDDEGWIVTRIGYFVGEWFAQRFGGAWMLNEIPDSRYFSRYVIGQFTQNISNIAAMIDPMQIALDFVSQPPSRSLSNLIHEIETELRDA